MGRVNALPGPLSHINWRFRTPDVAIIFTMIVGIVFTLWPGFVYGTTNAFALLGTIITILILLVYLATCLAVPFFYRHEHREEFNVLRHIVLPIVPAIILLFPIGAQFYPAPSFPLNLAAPICAGWLVVGILVVVFLRLRRPQSLAMSDKVFIEE